MSRHYMDDLVQFIKDEPKWETKISKSPLSIRVKRDGELPYYNFVYNLIETKFDKPMLYACRGSILQVSDDRKTVRPVCYPFSKFFNYGEGRAAQIDWSQPVKVRDKIDGSFIKRWWSPIENKWRWCTNGTMNLEGTLVDIPGLPFRTWSDLVAAALSSENVESLDRVPTVYTMMFEVTSLWNRVVINYGAKPKLWLLGLRNNETGEEVTPEEAQEKWGLSFEVPSSYDLDWEGVLELVGEMDKDHEGVVIQDAHFNRVKVKAESYLAIHRLKDASGQFSTKRLWECVQEGVQDDVRANFEEMREAVGQMEETMKSVRRELSKWIEYCVTVLEAPEMKRYDEKRRKKEYAAVVMNGDAKPFSSALFRVFTAWENGQTSFDSIVDEFVEKIDHETALRLSKTK